MRRLPQVGAAGLDPVVGTDRNIEFLLRIAIEISDEKAASSLSLALVAGEPTLERAGNAGAEFLPRLGDAIWPHNSTPPTQQRRRRKVAASPFIASLARMSSASPSPCARRAASCTHRHSGRRRSSRRAPSRRRCDRRSQPTAPDPDCSCSPWCCHTMRVT